MLSLLELFCRVDDFCHAFLADQKARQMAAPGKRQRNRSLAESEIMTGYPQDVGVIAFHQSHYRDFKAFYQSHVCQQWQSEFPGLVSYNRFIEFIPSVLVALYAYLHTLKGQGTGIAFIDATDLSVCDNHRIAQHRVFRGIAQRGKTSTVWFYGFKLHLVINDKGELLNVALRVPTWRG